VYTLFNSNLYSYIYILDIGDQDIQKKNKRGRPKTTNSISQKWTTEGKTIYFSFDH
jgi:hypothetical protein